MHIHACADRSSLGGCSSCTTTRSRRTARRRSSRSTSRRAVRAPPRRGRGGPRRARPPLADGRDAGPRRPRGGRGAARVLDRHGVRRRLRRRAAAAAPRRPAGRARGPALGPLLRRARPDPDAGDRRRPPAPRGRTRPTGVEAARRTLDTAYGVLQEHLAGRDGWIAADDFSLADCSAAPALFYGRAVHGWDADAHPAITAYYRRLVAHPSVRRVVDEARPYRDCPAPLAGGHGRARPRDAPPRSLRRPSSEGRANDHVGGRRHLRAARVRGAAGRSGRDPHELRDDGLSRAAGAAADPVADGVLVGLRGRHAAAGGALPGLRRRPARPGPLDAHAGPLHARQHGQRPRPLHRPRRSGGR